MDLALLKFQTDFANEIVSQAFGSTLWNPNAKENVDYMWTLASLKRPPFGSQVENGILPLVKGLLTYKFGLLIAEMGTGKTQMSFSTAYLLLENSKRRKLLFLTAGGKHIPKMIREAKAIYGDKAEVYTIVNKTMSEKVSKGEVRPEEVHDMVAPEGKILVFVLSKDTAKMDLTQEIVFGYGDYCPKCHKEILPKDFAIKSKRFPKNWRKEKEKYLPKIKPYNCPLCNASLESKVAKNIWQGSQVFPSKRAKMCLKGTRKISIGKKFRQLVNNSKDKVFDLIIVDEVHEMQSGTSLQGRVYRDLVNVSERAMIMTGTLSNGYPSSVFFILQAIMPMYFKKLGYNFYDVGKFVDHFGARKYTMAKDVIQTKGSKISIKVSELPKISDRIVSLLAPFTCWLKMEDLNLKMPPYSEQAVLVDMDEDLQIRLNEYKTRVVKLLSTYNPKLVKSFAQRFMYLQNNPTNPFAYEFEGEAVHVDENTGNTSIELKQFTEIFEAFPEDMTFTKEKRLIEICKAEMLANRKVLVYSIYNTAAKIADRLKKVLNEADLGVENLRIITMPDSVSGERIEPWIEENECDILIASPLKLATGLDLPQFPTIVFYESGTNLRVAQQAARRSWRAVGQSKHVKVIFLAYNGIQAHILDIMAKKMRAAAVIEGKKVVEGQIASVFDDDADFTRALNNIANELEKDFKPDFSSSHVAEGRLRPQTVLESRFSEILKEVTGHTEDDTVIPEVDEGEEIIESLEEEEEEEILESEEPQEEETSLKEEEEEEIVFNCNAKKEKSTFREEKKRVQSSLF